VPDAVADPALERCVIAALLQHYARYEQAESAL